MLPTLLRMQPRIHLTRRTASRHCQVTSTFSFTNTSKAFSAGLPYVHSLPSLCLCSRSPAILRDSWCACGEVVAALTPAHHTRASSSTLGPDAGSGHILALPWDFPPSATPFPCPPRCPTLLWDPPSTESRKLEKNIFPNKEGFSSCSANSCFQRQTLDKYILPA